MGKLHSVTDIYIDKMRAHGAADARVKTARFIFRVHAVSLGGWGFQGLEFEQPRSGSSATPYTCPEACHAPKNPEQIEMKITWSLHYPDHVIFQTCIFT